MRISDWSSDVFSSDLLSELSPEYRVFKQVGDRFLATFTFNGRSATGTLRTAMNVLIELAGDWRKALPADIPFGHIELRWHRHVMNGGKIDRSEEHTSELQSLMRISYAVFCLNKKNTT